MQKTAIVVDDHPMCRQATAMALQVADPEITVVEVASLAEARHYAEHATLMTLDLALPDTRGMHGVSLLRRDYPDLPLLVITGATNPEIERQVADAGAHGYLSKAVRISEMVQAMRAVLGANRYFSVNLEQPRDDNSETARLSHLTGAQTKVLRAMEGGRLNKQIAYDLGLSEITIKAHVKAILKKLGVPNRTQAILMMRRVEA